MICLDCYHYNKEKQAYDFPYFLLFDAGFYDKNVVLGCQLKHLTEQFELVSFTITEFIIP